MKRLPVESSNLKSVGYDESAFILEVEFHSGAIWQYYNVPAIEYRNLISAPSIGKYFNTNIRGAFPEAQV